MVKVFSLGSVVSCEDSWPSFVGCVRCCYGFRALSFENLRSGVVP